MKKILCLLTILCLPFFVKADQKEKVNIYFFYGRECPHCHEALTFFDSIEELYGQYYNLITYETWYDSQNEALLKKVSRFRKENKEFGVPYIIIGETSFEGYEEEDNEIIQKTIIKEYEKESRVDILEQVKKKEDQKAIVLLLFIVGIVSITIFIKKKKGKKYR